METIMCVLLTIMCLMFQWKLFLSLNWLWKLLVKCFVTKIAVVMVKWRNYLNWGGFLKYYNGNFTFYGWKINATREDNSVVAFTYTYKYVRFILRNKYLPNFDLNSKFPCFVLNVCYLLLQKFFLQIQSCCITIWVLKSLKMIL